MALREDLVPGATDTAAADARDLAPCIATGATGKRELLITLRDRSMRLKFSCWYANSVGVGQYARNLVLHERRG